MKTGKCKHNLGSLWIRLAIRPSEQMIAEMEKQTLAHLNYDKYALGNDDYYCYLAASGVGASLFESN